MPPRSIGLVLRLAICAALLVIPAAGQGDWGSPLNKCWEFANEYPSKNKLASDNDYIFIPTSKGSIVALNQDSGQLAWEADLGGNIFTELAISERRILSAASFGGQSGEKNLFVIREFDPESGLPFWQITEKGDQRSHLVIGPTGSLISYSESGNLEKLGVEGASIWKTDLETGITTNLVFDQGNLLFGTANKTLISMSESTGELLSQMNVKGVPNAVARFNGHLVVGDTEGTIYAFGGSNHSLIWRTKVGGGISEITIRGKSAIVTSKDNFVYSVAIDRGYKNWKRKLAGRILGMTEINPDNAVFVTSGSTTAVILDLNDGRLVNKIDLGEQFVSAPTRITGGFAVATESKVTAIKSSKCE